MTNGSRTFRATSSQSHLFFDCLSQVFPDAALLWAASLPTYILSLLTNSSLRYFLSELCLVWTISPLSHLFSAIPLSWAASFVRYFLSELPLLLSLSSVRISSLSGFGYSRVLFLNSFPTKAGFCGNTDLSLATTRATKPEQTSLFFYSHFLFLTSICYRDQTFALASVSTSQLVILPVWLNRWAESYPLTFARNSEVTRSILQRYTGNSRMVSLEQAEAPVRTVLWYWKCYGLCRFTDSPSCWLQRRNWWITMTMTDEGEPTSNNLLLQRCITCRIDRAWWLRWWLL